MKQIKIWVLNFWRSIWERGQMQRLKTIHSHMDLLVVDIDNTLTISKLNKPVNHINPTPRKSMIKYIKKSIEDGQKVIYLSARNFRLYNITIEWLKKYNLYNEQEQALFLVKSSIAKIQYLETMVKQNENLTFIDDLSYNHENGEIMYYEKTRSKLDQMNLKLLSIDFIESI